MTRKAATWALGQIGPEAVPSLVQALKSENISVRKSAALALGQIGPGAREAIPSLIQILEDDNRKVRIAASIALGDITGQGCCKELDWWMEW